MLRRLVRPTALVSHAVVLAVAVTCVVLGQWQLDRFDQARARTQLVEARMADDPVDVAELVAANLTDADGLTYRRARVTGTFLANEELLQRNRSYLGQPGFDVLTPLAFGGDGVILVRRGWVPNSLDVPPVTQAPPPSGQVTVTGVLEPSEPQPSFGARDPEVGALAVVFHADLERLAPQLPGDVVPLLLNLEAPGPAAADGLPRPRALALPDSGNHLSYAVQWHSFALIALIAYAAWWRKRLRDAGAGSSV